LAALSGVARTRRGDAYDSRLWNRLLDRLAARRRRIGRPFSSPFAAQLWFECPAHGWSLPGVVGSALLFIAGSLSIAPDDVGLSWRMLGIILGSPLFMAMMAGATLGKLQDPLSKIDRADFVLTRPVSSWSLVRGKLAVAAFGA